MQIIRELHAYPKNCTKPVLHINYATSRKLYPEQRKTASGSKAVFVHEQ